MHAPRWYRRLDRTIFVINILFFPYRKYLGNQHMLYTDVKLRRLFSLVLPLFLNQGFALEKFISFLTYAFESSQKLLTANFIR